MPLKNTRSVLIGVFVIPLLISLVIKTPLELLDKFQFSNQWIFLIVFSALTIYGLKNSIRQRIIFDSIAGISLAILCLIALVLLAFFPEIDSLKISFHLNTLSSSNIIMAGLITWWFANIVDLPDMRAQKLLSAQSSKAGYYSFLVGNGIVMIIQGIFICIYAIFKSNSYPLVDCICISALFISGCAQLMNLQHWSGNLMHGLFQKSISNLRLRNFIPMLISIGTAYFICFLTDSIFEIIQGILFFSAGVGPVYVLRWFYFRINAITQLTAMLSSLLLGIIYISLNFSGLIDFSNFNLFSLSSTNTAIFVLGLTNCLIWGSVMLASQNETENNFSKERIKQIHSNTRQNLTVKTFQFILTTLILLLLFFGPYFLFIGI